MTEQEWLAITDPAPMLEFLKEKASDRKLWLFSVACSRRVWASLTDEARRLMEFLERYADVRLTDDEMRRSHLNVDAFGSVSLARALLRIHVVVREWPAEEREQARLLRELFGNPFRPVTVDPNWLTTDVRLLAQGIYDQKAFDRMPILADALMDAGCTNPDVLAHCRQTSEHVRGCWVIDLLLDKS